MIIPKLKLGNLEIQNLSDVMDQEMGPVVAKGMGKPDWTYKDLPKIPKADFRAFEDALGDENMEWLTRASYPDGTQRGQLLISPEGMRRITIHDNGDWEIKT